MHACLHIRTYILYPYLTQKKRLMSIHCHSQLGDQSYLVPIQRSHLDSLHVRAYVRLRGESEAASQTRPPINVPPQRTNDAESERPIESRRRLIKALKFKRHLQGNNFDDLLPESGFESRVAASNHTYLDHWLRAKPPKADTSPLWPFCQSWCNNKTLDFTLHQCFHPLH